MLSLGVTGGLGSGKTVVARFFADKGGVHFDADRVAKDILLGSEEVLRAVTAAFGEDVLGADGKIETAKLAHHTFHDQAKQQELNEIIHPRVVAAALKQMAEAASQGAPLFILDAPLLFEAGLEKHLDKTLVVTAAEEVRIQRALDRGGLSEDDIRRRMALQMPEEEKLNKADIIVENNGTLEELTARLDQVYMTLFE